MKMSHYFTQQYYLLNINIAGPFSEILKPFFFWSPQKQTLEQQVLLSPLDETLLETVRIPKLFEFTTPVLKLRLEHSKYQTLTSPPPGGLVC